MENLKLLLELANYTAIDNSAGNVRERIGARISSSRYYSPIIATKPAILDLINVMVSSDAGKNWKSSITIGVDQVPTISKDNIEIAYEMGTLDL